MQTSLNNDLLSDPNNNYNLLEKIITDARNKHMAPKMVKFKKYKHKLSPWMTKDILKAIKLRDDIFHQLDFHQKQSPKWCLLHEKLKEHKCLVKKAIRQAKS